MPPRALIVHATNLLEIGFNTLAPDRLSPSGDPTNALFALTRALNRALSAKQPDVAVAIIDADADPGAWPAILAQQSEQLPALLEAHGLPVAVASEAAHVVASYTRAALDDGCDVVVVGSDKRLAQLVAEDVWWYDAYKDVRYTPELVRKRFDVGPESVAEWLALVGDEQTLPGVKGLGKKSATVLIETYGSVASAVEQAETVQGRAGKALRASIDAVRVELGRARLDRERELPSPFGELSYLSPSAESLGDLYGELGFFELLSSETSVSIDVDICSTPDELAEALRRFDDQPVAVYPLTDDPSPVRGNLAGAAIAQREHVVYAPFCAPRGDPHLAPGDLTEFLADPQRQVVGHDTKSLCVAFARQGVEVTGICGDSVCASHLAEPSNWAPHELSLIARHVLQRAIAEEDEVRGVGRSRKPWGRIAVDDAAGFAGQMADTAARAWAALEPRTDRALLGEYLELSDTLVRMELAGIACDADDLARAGDDFAEICARLETDIYGLAGKEFNLGSTKQLGSVLYEDLELPVVKKTKTGWSTANEALERIEHAHPIVPLVIRWRRLRRLQDSWVKALRKSIDSDGRVRSTFHPARSFSGRLVNSSPDLGRVPGKTPEMQRIRHAFFAPEGTTLLSVDYSQLGLFVLAHLSEDPALCEPLRDHLDLHVLTAAAVLDIDATEVGPSQREIGKVVNFATFAGQGASALALQLGVSAPEAKDIIARFDRRYAKVREFQDGQLELAHSRGYIQTVAGRKWPIGELRSPDHMLRSYAERLARRATHEGSVADVSRRGLLRADQALRERGLRAQPLLQVHDQVLFEVPDDELDAAIAAVVPAMENAFVLVVPLRVGCKAGPNWADLEPVTPR